MNQVTLEKIKTLLEETSAYSLYNETIGEPEELSHREPIALMYDTDSNIIFLLDYATPSNGWAKTAENQNPWIHIGYVDAMSCIDGDPFGEISEELTRSFKERMLINYFE